MAVTYGRDPGFNFCSHGYLFNYTGNPAVLPLITPEVTVNGKVGVGYDLVFPYNPDAPTLSVNGNVGVGRIDPQPYSAHSPLLRVDGNVEINPIPDQTHPSDVPLLTINGAAPETRMHPLLEVREGLIAQVEEGSVGATGAKYAVVGVTPRHPGGYADINPDACYGASVYWDSDFAMMQLIDVGGGSSDRKDMVLAWGDNRKDKLRIRFIGAVKKNKKTVNVARDVVRIKSSGAMWVRGKVSSPSDVRLKENIEPLRGALDKVMSLRGVSYTWKQSELDEDIDGTDEAGREIGLIAQEVERIIPEIISTEEDGYLAMDYTRMAPILLEAVKEQQSIIQAQSDRIDRLERALLSIGAHLNS